MAKERSTGSPPVFDFVYRRSRTGASNHGRRQPGPAPIIRIVPTSQASCQRSGAASCCRRQCRGARPCPGKEDVLFCNHLFQPGVTDSGPARAGPPVGPGPDRILPPAGARSVHGRMVCMHAYAAIARQIMASRRPAASCHVISRSGCRRRLVVGRLPGAKQFHDPKTSDMAEVMEPPMPYGRAARVDCCGTEGPRATGLRHHG